MRTKIILSIIWFLFMGINWVIIYLLGKEYTVLVFIAYIIITFLIWER